MKKKNDNITKLIIALLLLLVLILEIRKWVLNYIFQL